MEFRAGPAMNTVTIKLPEAQKLKEIWILFLTSGIALMILGVVSFSFSLTTTLATLPTICQEMNMSKPFLSPSIRYERNNLNWVM